MDHNRVDHGPAWITAMDHDFWTTTVLDQDHAES
jgi:hypothetical protein